MSFYSIPIEYCKRTNPEILNQLETCHICQKIPTPLIRDKHEFDNVYCTECSILNNITGIRATLKDRMILQELIIDCKYFCSKTFNYSQLDEYSDHCNDCESNRENKNICLRCQNILTESDHDCLLNTNLRITKQENNFKEFTENLIKNFDNRIQKLESIQEKINFQIIEILLENKRSSIESEKIKEETEKRRAQLIVDEKLQEQRNLKINKNIEELDINLANLTNKYNENKNNTISKFSDLENSISNYILVLSESLENNSQKFSREIDEKFNNCLSIKSKITQTDKTLNNLIKEQLKTSNENSTQWKSLNKKFSEIEINLNNLTINKIRKLEEKCSETNGLQSKISQIENKLENIKNEQLVLINANSKESKILQKKISDIDNALNKMKEDKINEKLNEYRNFSLEQKNINNKILSEIEVLKRKEGIKNKSDNIAYLNSKLLKLLNLQNNNFTSFIKTDTNKPLNPNLFPIESLDSIQDPIAFKNKYESINAELTLETQKYMDNKALYGNISNVIENAHTGVITNMVLKNDALITISIDNSIKKWNLNTLKLEKEIRYPHGKEKLIYSVILTDDEILITGGEDYYLRFWNKKFIQLYSINNEGCNVSTMILSDNVLIVSGYNAFENSYILKFYDLNLKLLINQLYTGHSKSIRKLLLLNSNNILLTGSDDSTFKVWNILNYNLQNYINENNKCLYTIKGHQGRIDTLVQLKYDDKILVSTDSYGTIIFSNIYKDYKIIHQSDISKYDKYPNVGSNTMTIYEILKSNMIVTITNNSSLLFWNLTNYQIARKVKFKEPELFTVIGLENDDGIVFSQGKNNNIIIWK